jgi:hypothetical protein
VVERASVQDSGKGWAFDIFLKKILIKSLNLFEDLK